MVTRSYRAFLTKLGQKTVRKKTELEITLSIVLKSLILSIKTVSIPSILISFLNSREHSA